MLFYLFAFSRLWNTKEDMLHESACQVQKFKLLLAYNVPFIWMFWIWIQVQIRFES